MQIIKGLQSKDKAVATFTTLATGVAAYTVGDAEYFKILVSCIPLVVFCFVFGIDWIWVKNDFKTADEIRSLNAKNNYKKELEAKIDVCEKALNDPQISNESIEQFKARKEEFYNLLLDTDIKSKEK